MDRSDLLLTIAEIAVAFAGFATLVSVIGRRRNLANPAMAGFRFRLMLELNLEVVAFSLIPFLPLHFGLSDEVAWRLASGLFLLADLTRAVFGWLRSRESYKTLPTFLRNTLDVLGLATWAMLAGNLAGAFGELAFAIYLTALMFGLFGAAASFLSVAGYIFAEAGE